MAQLTPMMQQYFEIKEKCRDYILFYRLGDFYEMFFDDAVLVSKELELTLTGRECGQEKRAPMCGVPYHASETYIGRLVRKGYKVAICEQVEDPKSTKGLVKREIVRMVTPGTVIEASMLDEHKNNFLCCLYAEGQNTGVCFADISTGEMYGVLTQSTGELFSEISRFMPRESLLGGTAAEDTVLHAFLKERMESIFSPLPAEVFAEEPALQAVSQCFGMEVIEKNALNENVLLCKALGGLLHYLEETQKSSLGSLNTLYIYQHGQYMELNLTARRNLELSETMRTKEKKGSLLSVIDRTKTAMGSRMIRQWLEKPLLNPIHIQKRQAVITELVDDALLRAEIGDNLKQMFDMERLISRIVYGTANCRDLRAMHMSLSYLPALKEQLSQIDVPLMNELNARIDPLEDACALIGAAIVEEPPVSVREGGLIQAGFRPEIDELRELASGGKGKIAEIEQRERDATGIKTLKVGYNRVFGYYLEVTKTNLDAVPAHYIRKQTLANCERYITDELKQLEGQVLSAQERLVSLEYDLFCSVREEIARQVHRIQRTAHALSNIDVLLALSDLAAEEHYVCPEVDLSGRIEIRDGRHPVVEKMLKGTMFIPNDTLLDQADNRTAIITGPNMAGKSTYMRQVALITILAQMGSFVPASAARIGVVDRVFTRVGASDDLASGQSTFMVEMSEVAEILRGATHNSLLILDEIGRGTSTYDGMSIARAVVEYIADKKRIGARTLFATHYHELTALEQLLPGVKNYNIAVKKRGDDITFLRKIIRGGADDSYGIEVAKLAGIPTQVIKRAKQILAELESHTSVLPVTQETPPDDQISMVDLSLNALADRLRVMRLDTMTPIEALTALHELQRMLD
ncbi:MAG: DNA mismatch repair protein MutS [Butyricicoccus pullicaecorum]|nr:DNA mismatch repair protein MutS [Butyricicoccus pullicaecorum]